MVKKLGLPQMISFSGSRMTAIGNAEPAWTEMPTESVAVCT